MALRNLFPRFSSTFFYSRAFAKRQSTLAIDQKFLVKFIALRYGPCENRDVFFFQTPLYKKNTQPYSGTRFHVENKE